MKYIVAGHEAITAVEFAELALGNSDALWLGVQGETEMERAARLDAARDIIPDPDFSKLPDNLIGLATQVVKDNPDLFNVVPLARPARRRPARKGVAA